MNRRELLKIAVAGLGSIRGAVEAIESDPLYLIVKTRPQLTVVQRCHIREQILGEFEKCMIPSPPEFHRLPDGSLTLIGSH